MNDAVNRKIAGRLGDCDRERSVGRFADQNIVGKANEFGSKMVKLIDDLIDWPDGALFKRALGPSLQR